MARISPGDEESENAWRHRTPSELNAAIVARLLSHDISLFSAKDQEAAVWAAFHFGCQLADETHGTDEEAYGDAKDYRRTCIRWALLDVRACNEVEAALFKTGKAEGDPRLRAFQAGFRARRRELGEGG